MVVDMTFISKKLNLLKLLINHSCEPSPMGGVLQQ